MNSRSAIAIFDIGKTNKKIFLFDENYKIVKEKSVQLPETFDDDGEPCEDVEALKNWVHHERLELSSFSEYKIKAINFSAYGASLVHLSPEGKPVCPLYNYLKKYPDVLQNQLYKKYGGRETFSSVTASPSMGSLNSGLQLYRIKYEKPDLLNQIRYSLHLPQWIAYLFTNKPYSDITSIGCHTAMWDFRRNQYHEWLFNEELIDKLAPIFPSDNTTQIDLNGQSTVIGVGLHDSSSALIPYLASYRESFVLLSTGTWCISLNPFDQSPLTVEELLQDCLCYMDYRGKPVKASRLFAGYEHEKETARIAEYFYCQRDYYKNLQFEADIVSKLKMQNESSKKDIKVGKGGDRFLFAQRDLSIFTGYSEAYHQLMLDLVEQQVVSTNLVLRDVRRIFVDGGFSKNAIYMNLLALAFPDLKVYATDVPEGSAIGAAIPIHDKWNDHPIPADFAGLKHYECLS